MKSTKLRSLGKKRTQLTKLLADQPCCNTDNMRLVRVNERLAKIHERDLDTYDKTGVMPKFVVEPWMVKYGIR